jgi:PmbA protein
MQSTGNAGGCHNLIVHPGKRDLRGLLRKMGRGLLVTELLGQGVNYVTGDYSRGAAGYWVEGGERKRLEGKGVKGFQLFDSRPKMLPG